ncbi:uncharacterized protein LOC135834660 [Planococcus citri]|uniref:uncharacterized protein LOC135834660 n=1 Tax=Planococcus citri TaxID=170843 RepID=UPI0031F9C698
MDIVTRFKTFKAKECCCGCTLRTGTLILLWMILILNSLDAIYYLSQLLYKSGVVTFMTFRAAYLFVSCITGVIVSLFGIFGIQKNIPKYLSYSYYYILYDVAFLFMCAIVALVKPTWHRYYILADKYALSAPGGGEFTVIIIIVYFFAGGLLSYFAIIVRSCRDAMEKNPTRARGQFNGMPDPAAAGYNVA